MKVDTTLGVLGVISPQLAAAGTCAEWIYAIDVAGLGYTFRILAEKTEAQEFDSEYVKTIVNFVLSVLDAMKKVDHKFAYSLSFIFNLIDTAFACAHVLNIYIEVHQAIHAAFSEACIPIFMVIVGSPVNVSIIDDTGNIVGVFEDGTIIEHIPGSSASQFDHFKRVIVPGDGSTNEIFIEGHDNGEADVSIFRPKGLGSLTIISSTQSTTPIVSEMITHKGVYVTPNTEIRIDMDPTSNPTYTMEIDNNGDGTIDYTKEPDSIETITEQKVEEIGGTPSGEVTGINLWVLYNGVWTKDLAAIDYGEWPYMLLYLDQGQRILMEDTYPSGYVTTKDLGYLSPGYHYYRWIADAVGWHKIVADGSITGQSNEIFVYVCQI